LTPRLLSKNAKIRILKIIILLVVLYGSETWSLTLREEHRLTVFDQVKDEMGMSWSTNGEKMNACRILVGKPE
jgi:hypothetical protein